MTSVLIVDDNEGLVATVAMMLEREGFEVHTAFNGLHGYSTYYRCPTDWVLTDIQMPQLDGLDMMQYIRAVNPGVKAVYMSGATDRFEARLEQERREHAVRVLSKPFTRTALLTEIATA